MDATGAAMPDDIPYMMADTPEEFERVMLTCWSSAKSGRVRIDCWCWSCDSTIAEAQRMNGQRPEFAIFIVCPDCGDKRCPRAAYHYRDCQMADDIPF